MAVDEYGDVSMPTSMGRLDEKGGGWRDILNRRGLLLHAASVAHRLGTEARLLCNLLTNARPRDDVIIAAPLSSAVSWAT
jgi:hypothetical protein